MTNHSRKRAGSVRRSAENLELAWLLTTKSSDVSKRQLMASGLASTGTAGTMRSVLNEIKHDPELLEMSWADVKREWQIRKLAERFTAAGVAKAYARCPAKALKALRQIIPDLPQGSSKLNSGRQRR